MIVLNDEQARTLHQLLTRILLNEAYRISDIEDALIWTSPENRQILCPFDLVWSRNLAQEIVREPRNQP
jgi:Leu/Phe-tRNA-protein transferase